MEYWLDILLGIDATEVVGMASSTDESSRFLGSRIFKGDDFWQLVIRFFFNLSMLFAIVRMIYYPRAKKKNYLFTYLIFGSIIFLLCHLLLSAKLKIEFALGLFAIFAIIRYRTSVIPIKEMTYLFVVTGISVINALAVKKVSHAEVLFANFIVIGLAWLLEKIVHRNAEVSKVILYEKIELIKPENRLKLIEDLKERTGLPVHRVSIGRINFLRDTAQIRIYYRENDPLDSFEENELFISSDDGGD